MDESFSKHYFSLKGTDAEKFVHELAEKTFLLDWCFLNPKLPDGKELCDLLVIFDDTAIIWQIKDLKLDKDGKYKKAEVDKNLRQLAGAKRQLFVLKTPISLQNARRTIETFNPSQIKQIFLISVLLGEGEEYFSFIDEIKTDKVHVFTRDFTQIVLNELDTVNDFIDYLKAIETFIDTEKSLNITIVGGEEEFLAFYLRNDRSFERLESMNYIRIEDGLWEHLQSEPEFKAKKKADEISYTWDSIINRAHEGSEKYELVARELARPGRLHRRVLGKEFYDAYVLAHEDEKNSFHKHFILLEGIPITYCFLFIDDIESRNNRKAIFEAICYMARGKYPQNKKVLIIATDKKNRRTSLYEFFLDMSAWADENQRNMEQLQKQTGILENPIIKYVHEDEYPKVK
ncbi:MAG: hypothetical protein ACYCTB_11445 [bacterium]